MALRPAELPPVDPGLAEALHKVLTSARPSGEDEDADGPQGQPCSLLIGLGVIGDATPSLAFTIRDNETGEAYHLVIGPKGVPVAWHRPPTRSR